MSPLFLVLCAIVNIEASRILCVFPIPSFSHQIIFRPLTQELAKRGHEVVVITTDPAFPKREAPSNLTEIDVHDISYKIWVDYFTGKGTGKKTDLSGQMRAFFEQFTIIFAKQLETNEVREIIFDKKRKFDLLLVEALSRPTLALSHLFNVPVIQINSFGNIYNVAHIVGIGHPLLYPFSSQQRIYNLTVWEKLREIYNYLEFQHIFDTNEEFENKLIRDTLGPNIPTLTDLQKNVKMVFLNAYHLWEENRPIPPNVIYIGGILPKLEKGLEKELKEFLDDSKHGVIYVSFGTNVFPSALPPENIQMIIEVVSQLPYDVLFKWDKDELPGATKKIKIGKWFPQFDILKHPKTKLFITQGGLQSTDEALAAGVPLLGIPLLGDQWYNTEKYERHGIGIQLSIETITEKQLMEAIQKLINDNSYRGNIVKIRTLMLDQPQSAIERAVWWTEYVLRHDGASHLRAPSANMHWLEFFEVKLLLTCILLIAAVTSIIIFIISKIIRIAKTYAGKVNRKTKFE